MDKCPIFDKALQCFINFEGECCSIAPGVSRAIYLADDQFYAGTCEADKICLEPTSSSEAKSCQDGFVCDEGGNISYECPKGYFCDFGTTPDSLFTFICPSGKICPSGTEMTNRKISCYKNFFCLPGTSDPVIGSMAEDGLNRGINMINNNPFLRMVNVIYMGQDSFSLLSDHDFRCLTDKSKFEQKDNRALTTKSSLQESCSRDSKWFLVDAALQRRECDCISQFFTIAAVYRLWQVSLLWLEGDICQTNRYIIKYAGAYLSKSCVFFSLIFSVQKFRKLCQTFQKKPVNGHHPQLLV